MVRGEAIIVLSGTGPAASNRPDSLVPTNWWGPRLAKLTLVRNHYLRVQIIRRRIFNNLDFTAKSVLAGVEKYQHFIRNIGGSTNLLYAKLVHLEAVEKKLSMNEQEIFKRITVHIKSNERQRAEIAASELANMKKMHKKIKDSRLVLEAATIRFSTLKDYAEILDTINPTVEMLNSIHKDIARAVPDVNSTLSEVSNVTTGILLSSNVPEPQKISTPVDEDAKSILGEVEDKLEEGARANLPDPSILSKLKKQEAHNQELCEV